MDFYEVIQRRRSIRRFKPDAIPAPLVADIMRVAALSGEGRYLERCRVLAVSKRETIERMKAACLETIERRVVTWTDADEASWTQLGIPFPKHEQVGTTQRDHFRYFSRRFDTFFGDAPLVLAMATQPLLWEAAPHVWPNLQRIGAVMQAIQLAAVEKGLGSCCMTGPLHSRQAHQHILGLESPWEIVALMPLGVPAYEPAPRPRKPLAEVLRWLGPYGTGDEGIAGGEGEERVARRQVELSEVMRRCRNVNHFQPHPVPKAEVEEIVHLATLAPNSLNQQKWGFVAITTPEVREGIREAVACAAAEIARREPEEAQGLRDEMAFLDGPQVQHVPAWTEAPRSWADFMSRRAARLAEAPAAIAVLNQALPLGLSSAGWSDIESIGCAVETLMLAAAARGYGTCWMTSPLIAWPEVDRLVGARDLWRTVALVPLGLPGEEAPQEESTLSRFFTWVE